MIFTRYIELQTRGNADMHDITDAVARHVRESELTDGIVAIFCPSATSALTTIPLSSIT